MRAALDGANPPRDASELLQIAQTWAGRTLEELAAHQGHVLPERLTRAKGLVGQLVERCLGADAGNRSAPDFTALGVELKTLPIGANGKPRESTFVSTLAMREVHQLEWPESRVFSKLRHVLWVPVEADPKLPLARRRLGSPLLWRPTSEQEARLRCDWEQLMGLIASGEVEQITAHLGRCLQIRPKAAHSRIRTLLLDENGAPQRTLPLGFYLRPSFTADLLTDLLHPSPS